MAPMAVSGTPSRFPRAVRGLLHRWPTWAALALVALNLTDVGNGVEFAVVLAVSALGYLAMGVLDRPSATWPVLAALLATVVVSRGADVSPWPVLVGLGGVLVVVGLRNGQLRRPGLYRRQLPVAVLLLSAGLAAIAVSPEVGVHLVIAGLLGHAVWDAVHWRAHAIVSRSFAEWCGVFDLSLGLGLLLLV